MLGLRDGSLWVEVGFVTVEMGILHGYMKCGDKANMGISHVCARPSTGGYKIDLFVKSGMLLGVPCFFSPYIWKVPLKLQLICF